MNKHYHHKPVCHTVYLALTDSIIITNMIVGLGEFISMNDNDELTSVLYAYYLQSCHVGHCVANTNLGGLINVQLI